MPSHPPRRDRLLTIATVAIRIVLILLWVALGVLAIAIPALLLNQAEVVAAVHANRPLLDPATLLPLLLGIMLGAMALLALGLLFMRRLLAIVRTVADDPFVPENARRLRIMAWLLLAIELGGFALGNLARWITDPPHDGHELSITSLIAVISLFVLARVFTRGTEMRDEIEGTV